MVAFADAAAQCAEIGEGGQGLVHPLLVLEFLEAAEVHQHLLHLNFEVFREVGRTSTLHVHNDRIIFLRVHWLAFQLGILQLDLGFGKHFLARARGTSKKESTSAKGKSRGRGYV